MTQVAGDHYLEIFESPVRKAFKKRLGALSDFFLAEVSLPEAIRSNGRVVDAIVSKEARHEIRITAIPC